MGDKESQIANRRPPKTRGMVCAGNTQSVSVGEYLDKQAMPSSGVTRGEFAKRIGVSRSQLYHLIKNKARLTVDLAVKLGEFTGKSAREWLEIQLHWDLENLNAQGMVEKSPGRAADMAAPLQCT